MLPVFSSELQVRKSSAPPIVWMALYPPSGCHQCSGWLRIITSQSVDVSFQGPEDVSCYRVCFVLGAVLYLGLFCAWGCFIPGAVLCLGAGAVNLGMFCVWGCFALGAVLYLGLFCTWGCFVPGAVLYLGLFCVWG